MKRNKTFNELFSSPKYQIKFEGVESRTICFKSNDCEDIYVKTNAPKHEIENAIDFQNAYRCEYKDNEEFDFDGDFAIMEAYIKDKGYSFKVVSNASEIYNW